LGKGYKLFPSVIGIKVLNKKKVRIRHLLCLDLSQSVSNAIPYPVAGSKKRHLINS